VRAGSCEPYDWWPIGLAGIHDGSELRQWNSDVQASTLPRPCPSRSTTRSRPTRMCTGSWSSFFPLIGALIGNQGRAHYFSLERCNRSMPSTYLEQRVRRKEAVGDRACGRACWGAN
jgi:hypothetical protein